MGSDIYAALVSFVELLKKRGVKKNLLGSWEGCVVGGRCQAKVEK